MCGFRRREKCMSKGQLSSPRIDQLVNSTAGHELLTFMDAFSGYNKIVMSEEEEEKTSFVNSQGLYSYKVMPFRLKNAKTMYQRLVNHMFNKKIGRNIEAYTGDMPVESREEKSHLDNLQETFNTLRRYQIKQNPAKCVFGAS